jgi:endogenous inhibitor of DNA gyrase (YacG/DUF329 family)
MGAELFLVACPACGAMHSAPGSPHYCSIPCYRQGHGLDEPETGDRRRLCPGCMRYLDAGTSRRYCSDACKLADWKRRHPRPSSPEAKIATMGLEDVVVERAGAPYLAEDSARVVEEATESLGRLRALQWVGDSGAMLHLLGSLVSQIESQLPDVIADARDQDYSWNEISALLGSSRERVKRLAAFADEGRHPPLD